MTFLPQKSPVVTGGHRRSNGGQKEVKFERKKSTEGPNFWHLFSNYIPDQHLLWRFDLKSYKRPPEVIGGQKEVKFEKCTQGPNFWHAYPCDIPDLLWQWHFDPKIDNRSTEVTGGQNKVKFEKMHIGTQFVACILI